MVVYTDRQVANLSYLTTPVEKLSLTVKGSEVVLIYVFKHV